MPTAEQHSWLQSALGVVGDLADSVGGAVTDTVNTVGQAVNSTIDTVTTEVNSAASAVESVVDSVETTVGNAVTSTVNTVGQAVNATIDTVTTEVGNAATAVGSVVDTVETKVADAVTGAVDTVAPAIDRAVNTAENAVGTVVNAATSAVGTAVDAVEGVANAAYDTVSGLFSSPPDSALAEPQTGAHQDQSLYLTEPGDAHDVQSSDINQGVGMGDCFLLSSIGEIARINPEMIKHMIKDNGDGTYTVTLYQRDDGFFGGIASFFTGNHEFKKVEVTVDGNFPGPGGANQPASVNSQPGQDNVGSQHEIWVQVIEKAYAKLHGGYAGIKDGGHESDALEALTGQNASATGPSGVTLDALKAAFDAGKPITMGTPERDNLPYNLVGGHAYMVENVVVSGSDGTITLRNPWGTTQSQPPNPVPFSRLGDAFDEVTIGGAIPPRPADSGAQPGAGS